MHPKAPGLTKEADTEAFLADALQAEIAFSEAEVKMMKLCNVFAFCKMNKPAKADVVKPSAVKRALICNLCEHFELYCEQFDQAMMDVAQALLNFAGSHPECVQADGSVVGALINAAGETVPVYTSEIVQHLQDLQALKDDMESEFCEKKNEVLCLLDLETEDK